MAFIRAIASRGGGVDFPAGAATTLCHGQRGRLPNIVLDTIMHLGAAFHGRGMGVAQSPASLNPKKKVFFFHP
jgi:hypothetical protein